MLTGGIVMLEGHVRMSLQEGYHMSEEDSPQFRDIQLVVTVLVHHCNSRTDSGEAKVERHASSEIRPCQSALLLDTLVASPSS